MTGRTVVDAPIEFDVHTHVGADAALYGAGWWPYASSGQDLLDHMDQHAVRRSVAFPMGIPSAFDTEAFVCDRSLTLLPGRFPFDRENQLLRTEIGRLDARERLLQFLMFDPARAVEGQVEQLEAMAPHAWGLKTQTTLLRSPITELLGTGSAILDVARRFDLPVLIHTAVHPQDAWAQVADCLAVAEANPDLRFNLAHNLRFDDAGVRRAATLPNVWVDCSALLTHCRFAREDLVVVPEAGQRLEADYGDPSRTLETVAAVLGERFLWGTDSPFMSWCDDTREVVHSYAQEIEAIRGVEPALFESMTDTQPRRWLGRRAA